MRVLLNCLRIVFMFAAAIFGSATVSAQSVALFLPDIAENGAVVRVAAQFSPALRNGEQALLSVDGQEVLLASLQTGSLVEFASNLRAFSLNPSFKLQRIQDGRVVAEVQRSTKIVLIAQSGASDALNISTARTRVSVDSNGVGQLRVLLAAQNGYAGTLAVQDANFSASFTSRGGLSTNPLLSVSGSFGAAVTISSGGQALATTPSPAIAPRGNDDPKVRGRSAKGG